MSVGNQPLSPELEAVISPSSHVHPALAPAFRSYFTRFRARIIASNSESILVSNGRINHRLSEGNAEFALCLVLQEKKEKQEEVNWVLILVFIAK